MKKLAIAVAGLLVVLVAALLIGPNFIDWNRYKGSFTAAVEEATGRKLTIAGNLNLRLLPQPTLAARDVRFANISGGSQTDMLALSGLQVLVGLGPLLRGDIEVRSLRLVEPVLTLERLADGRVNWNFGRKPDLPANAAPLPGATPAPAAPPSSPPVALQEVVIVDGRITWRDAQAGQFEQFDDVDATLTVVTPDNGPFSVQGSLRVRGLPLSLNAAVGDLGRPSTPVTLELALTGGDKVALAVRGLVSELRGAPRLQAKLEGDVTRLSALAMALEKAGFAFAPPAALASQALSVRGDVAGGLDDLALNNVALQLGDTRATGAAAITLSPQAKVDATLAFGRLDLDPWVAAATVDKKPAAPPAARPNAATPPALRPAVQASASRFEVALAVTAEAANLRGGVLRQIDLVASLRGNGLDLRRFSAVLPGNTDVALAGRVAPDEATRFQGTLDAQTPDLRSLLAWAGVDIAGVPADRLRQASLRTSLRLTPDVVESSDIDLQVDASRLTGSAAYARRERPSFSIDAAIDRLNADAYRAASAGSSPGTGGTGGGASSAKSPSIPFNDLDANVKLRVDALTIDGQQVRDAVMDAGLLGGTLTLRTARIGDLGGLRAAVTGTVAALATKPDFALSFSVAAPDGGALLRLAGQPVPPSTTRAGALTMEGSARGALSALAIDVTAKTGPGTASAVGTLSLDDTPSVDLTLKAAHPETVQFIQAWGLDYRPAASNLGPLRLAARVSGPTDKLSISDLDAGLGQVNLLGSATYDTTAARPKLTARLETSEILVDLFLPRETEGGATRAARSGGSSGTSAPQGSGRGRWSTDPFDFTVLDAIDAEISLVARALTYGEYRFVEPRLTLVAKDGTARIAPLTGKLFGGDVTLELTLASAGTPALTARVSLDNSDLEQALRDSADIDRLTGRASLDGNFTARGRSQADMIASLAGTATFTARDGLVRGVDLRALSDRLKELDQITDFLDLIGRTTGGGQTRYTTMSGSFQIERGVARTNDLAAQFDAATGSGQGSLDLPNWRIDMATVAKLTEHPNAPSVGLDLSGPLDRPDRDIRTRDLEAFLGQRVGETVLRRLLRSRDGEVSAPAGSPAQPQPSQPRLPNVLGDVLQDVLRRSRDR